MNIQQLRIVNEAVSCDYNLTTVAARLFTSQSGVSKHILDLEAELGMQLFHRKGKRLLGLTEPGRQALPLARRILHDMQNLRNLAEEYTSQDKGRLVVAATHTQARYILPEIVVSFRRRFPDVNLILQQGTPDEIATMLLEGSADIGIATESLGETPGLEVTPFHRWHHGVVVPHGHPLQNAPGLTLDAIAAFPLVTYHEGFTGRALIEKTFREAGRIPDIVIAAMDADIIKAYVDLGLGVGIIASVAFDQSKDQRLAFLDCAHIFPENLSVLATRQNHLLRGFAKAFLELCASNPDKQALPDIQP